jgi:hypothetical protein
MRQTIFGADGRTAPRAAPGPAFEEPGVGFVAGFLRTARQVLASPQSFFRRLGPDRPGRALVYGWILATLALVAMTGYSLWQLDLNHEELLGQLRANAALLAEGVKPEAALDTLRSFFLVHLIAAPVMALVRLLIACFLVHGITALMGRKSRSFRLTMKSVAYGVTPLIFLAVPLVGLLVGVLWWVVVQTIALSGTHRLAPGRAALAVLLSGACLILLEIGYLEISFA